MTVPTMPGSALFQDLRLCSSFTIGGHQLLTLASDFDVKPLLGAPDARGDNTVTPGVAGTDPNPRRATNTARQLDVVVEGFVSLAGVAASDPWAQWVTNWFALRAWTDPIGTGDGTAAASVVMPGKTISGRIQPLGLLITEMVGPVCSAKFSYSLPYGALA